jgi:hypothetical protein
VSNRLGENILHAFLLSQSRGLIKCIEQLIQSDRKVPVHSSEVGSNLRWQQGECAVLTFTVGVGSDPNGHVTTDTYAT